MRSGDIKRPVKQKKSLSQIFLKATWPLQKMVDRLKSWDVTHVLEIGPGQGALTIPLLEAGFKVVAVEKDRGFADILERKLADLGFQQSCQIVQKDILKYDVQGWLDSLPPEAKPAIVGNIPYKISTPILVKSIPFLEKILGLMFLVQAEFATRMVAAAGSKEYGSLSVFVQLRAKTTLEAKVKSECFRPKPKVDSALVSLTPLQTMYPAPLLKSVESVTRAAFSQRRKKLRNGVRSFLKDRLGEGSPIDLDRRPETLSPLEFIELTRFLAS